jgi:hypothetical protein
VKWWAYIAFKLYDGYEAEAVNTSVLERFADGVEVSAECRTAMPYLVSIGLLSGTADGRLLPNNPMSRARSAYFGKGAPRVGQVQDARFTRLR